MISRMELLGLVLVSENIFLVSIATKMSSWIYLHSSSTPEPEHPNTNTSFLG